MEFGFLENKEVSKSVLGIFLLWKRDNLRKFKTDCGEFASFSEAPTLLKQPTPLQRLVPRDTSPGGESWSCHDLLCWESGNRLASAQTRLLELAIFFLD